MMDGMSSPSKWQTGRVMRRSGRGKIVRGAAAAALSLPVAFGMPAIVWLMIPYAQWPAFGR